MRTTNNLFRNHEGYADPTAYEALKPMMDEESVINQELYDLVKTLKYIINNSEFELVTRIELRHIKTGKIFR